MRPGSSSLINLTNIAFTCNKEKVYAIEYFDTDDAEVVTEVLLPITDTFSKITSVATGKELNFTKQTKDILFSVKSIQTDSTDCTLLLLNIDSI